MNIVWIDGGLGNQMFQYALAMKLESLGKMVKIDVTKYAQHYAHNGFELDRVFGISCTYAEEREICLFGYRKSNHWTEFLKKSPFRKKTIYTNESLAFDENVLELDGYYLEGYWQSEKYFSDIRDKVIEVYQFPEFSTEQQMEDAKRMKETFSIGLHIRRGDYLNYPYYCDICTLDYYRKAIKYFEERFCDEKLMFYIFTNDVSWAEQHFQSENCYFVKGNTGTESFRDMQLMSLCRHNIIANSSFSWWGAWLNRNNDQIVVAPSRWHNGFDEKQIDVVPENWVRIKG